jgi:hypothetical protein
MQPSSTTVILANSRIVATPLGRHQPLDRFAMDLLLSPGKSAPQEAEQVG